MKWFFCKDDKAWISKDTTSALRDEHRVIVLDVLYHPLSYGIDIMDSERNDPLFSSFFV